MRLPALTWPALMNARTCLFSRCYKCGLTPRSSWAPTAWHTGHQALELRPILRLLSSAPRRWCQV